MDIIIYSQANISHLPFRRLLKLIQEIVIMTITQTSFAIMAITLK